MFACNIFENSITACDVHPYVRKIGEQGHSACAFYANLAWMVDPFHIDGHKVSNRIFIYIYQFQSSFKEKKCTLSDPECQYHPKLPKFKHLTEGINLEICEQVCICINIGQTINFFQSLSAKLTDGNIQCVFLPKIKDWFSSRSLTMRETGGNINK